MVLSSPERILFPMIQALSVLASATGLSTSAGLNAYLPLLAVGLAARYTSLIRLEGPWTVLTNGWVLGILFVLLFIEMAVDKIPGADTLNDGIQSFVRPVAGAILFVAGSGAFGESSPVAAGLLGLAIAGGVHTIRMLARPVVTVSTGGLGNWLVSLAGDLLALLLVILALLVPLAVLILIIVLIALIVRKMSSRRAPA